MLANLCVCVDFPAPLHVCEIRRALVPTLMEEPPGVKREFSPLVSRSAVLSPSEMVYRNVRTPSLLPPDTYSPTASGPEFNSKIGVPSTFCRKDSKICFKATEENMKEMKTKKTKQTKKTDVKSHATIAARVSARVGFSGRVFRYIGLHILRTPYPDHAN